MILASEHEEYTSLGEVCVPLRMDAELIVHNMVPGGRWDGVRRRVTK